MTVRPLLFFWLIACGLWLTERAFDASQPSDYIGTLVVTAADIQQLEQSHVQATSQPPDRTQMAAMLSQLLQERVLINEARRLELDKADPVVAERISKNLEFLDQAKGSSAQWREQMLQQDPVIQRRLLERMQALLATSQTGNTVAHEDLASYYDTHQEDYRESSRYRVELSLVKDATAPLILAAPTQALSVANLAKLLPQALLERLLKAQPGDVLQQQSAVGTHSVTLIAVEEGRVLPLAEIRTRVWSDYHRWRATQMSNRYAHQLLQFYRIEMPASYRELLSGTEQGGNIFAGVES